MYSAEEKAKAIKTYLENNCNAGKTVRELGYPEYEGQELEDFYKHYKIFITCLLIPAYGT